MLNVKIDNTWYQADEAVVNRMTDYYDTMIEYVNKTVALETELERIFEAVKHYQMKVETSTAHPTRETRLEAWEARERLFKLLPKKQLDFFRK